MNKNNVISVFHFINRLYYTIKIPVFAKKLLLYIHQLKNQHKTTPFGWERASIHAQKRSGPFSSTCEVRTERANECRLLFVLHSRDLDVEKLKWTYIV